MGEITTLKPILLGGEMNLKEMYEDMMNSDFNKLQDFINKFDELVIILRTMENKGQTRYTGEDLNILDKLDTKIELELIKKEDFLELEKLIFRFM